MGSKQTNKQTNEPLGFLLIKELLVYLEHFMFLVLTWVFLPLKIEADLLKIERGTGTFQKCQIDFIYLVYLRKPNRKQGFCSILKLLFVPPLSIIDTSPFLYNFVSILYDCLFADKNLVKPKKVAR